MVSLVFKCSWLAPWHGVLVIYAPVKRMLPIFWHSRHTHKHTHGHTQSVLRQKKTKCCCEPEMCTCFDFCNCQNSPRSSLCLLYSSVNNTSHSSAAVTLCSAALKSKPKHKREHACWLAHMCRGLTQAWKHTYQHPNYFVMQEKKSHVYEHALPLTCHGWKIPNSYTYIKRHNTKWSPLKTLPAWIMNKSTFSSSTVYPVLRRQCHWSHCSKPRAQVRWWKCSFINHPLLPNALICCCCSSPVLSSARGRSAVCALVCFVASVFMFRV